MLSCRTLPFTTRETVQTGWDRDAKVSVWRRGPSCWLRPWEDPYFLSLTTQQCHSLFTAEGLPELRGQLLFTSNSYASYSIITNKSLLNKQMSPHSSSFLGPLLTLGWRFKSTSQVATLPKLPECSSEFQELFNTSYNANTSFSRPSLSWSPFLFFFTLVGSWNTNNSSAVSGCQRQKDIMQNRKKLLKNF